MKKIIKILCLIFVLVFITSCTVEEHEHEFGDEYKYDESKHWTECNVRGCRERNNEGKHDYTILDTTIVNGIYTITKKCYACDYAISEEFVYDLVVDTSEEWNYLFQTLELTNFSMNVYFKEEDTIIESYCKVTENGIEVNDEGDLTYSIRQSDGTFNTYDYYEYSGNWYLDDDTSDETYNSFIEEARLSFKFVDEFDKFTYDLSTGVYKCKDGLIAVLDENGEYVQEFKLFNTEVVIVEGKVSSIKSDYGMEGELETASFEYYDIGNTVITFTEDMISNLVHDHRLTNEYSYDETKHWKECTVFGCNEKVLEDSHHMSVSNSSLVDDIYYITKKCNICGYEVTEEHAYDSVVDTSEEWNVLFEAFKLTNFSMNVYFKEGDTIIENYCKVTENGIEVNDEGDLTYSIRQSDGTFNTYDYYEYSGNWYLDDDTSDETYNSFIEEEARLSFKFVDEFDKFTYDLSTGVYKCKDGLIAVLDENGEFVQEFKLFNTEVVIVEGKVSSIKSDYGMEGVLETASFEYYDIGNTVITFTEDMISNLVHDHRLTNEYSYDETKHWKECTVFGCNEKALENSHHMSVSNSSLVDDIYYITKKCNICDYEVTEEHAYDSVVDTSEEWNVLFEAFKLTNFSMHIYFKEEDTIIESYCKVTENGIEVNDEGDVLYSIKQNDGSYLTFERYEGEEEWDLWEDTSDETYNSVIEEVLLSFQFIDTFDKFTYDLSTGVYKCTDELTAFIYPDNEEEREEMKLFNTEVVIIDGKVFSIKSDYKFESNLGIATFEYFDIGTSVVIVPEGVIENLLEQ